MAVSKGAGRKPVLSVRRGFLRSVGEPARKMRPKSVTLLMQRLRREMKKTKGSKWN